jgi:zinc finger protein|tara:strand:+ start:922 stop:1461 length:540 start_codon:yes stop_codon:yes gene_type:complete
MLVNVHEIPYFGEQTELTLACKSCGWRKTDFIAGDGGEPVAWSIPINADTLDGRVVRSSSCTVRIPELDIEVEPGIAADGYVSNVEGVISRFEDAIRMLMRQAQTEGDIGDVDSCEAFLGRLASAKAGGGQTVSLVLLDPLGHSKIMHDSATSRDLTDEEVETLYTGPSIPVFDMSDLE